MDRSLDEIIAEDPHKQKRSSGGRRNQGRRRDRNDGIRKSQPGDRVNLNLDWVHDKYEDDRDSRPSRNSRRSNRSPERISTLTRVRVENLHYDINENDLQDLFGRIGPVLDLHMVYDRAGRSEGVAFVTYKNLRDAHTSLQEYDGANAKGQPIRLSLVPGRRENRRDNHKSLFDRVEQPGRDGRSLSPAEGEGRRRRGGGGGGGGRDRRSDVSKPAPDNIDRYVPGEGGSAPRRGRRGGGGDGKDGRRGGENGGGRRGNVRPRKTQEELDQEMEDYWGTSADKPAQEEAQAAPVETAPAPAAPATDDIDMIE